jgi:hypothetical protein
MRNPIRCVVPALALVFACADPGPERVGRADQAVTNGAPADLEAVVALVDADGSLSCTGTLVAPRVVVTAAHCLTEDAPSEVRIGPDPTNPRRVVPVLERRAHPDFDAVTLANDVAVLWLAARMEDVAPAALPADAALPAEGEPVRVAGFGRSDAPAGQHAQRAGFARVATSDDGLLRLLPGPSQPCAGDSGGPVFRGETGEELLAVTSHGDRDCLDHAVAAPVYPAIAPLIAPFLERSDSDDAGGCSTAGPMRPSPCTWLAVLALLAASRRKEVS